MERVSLCPACTACPEVVLDGDTIRIGGDAVHVALVGECSIPVV